ncbi:TPA: hypothetical protein N0F65_003232 [Lagenidium giganteum]|uniref:Gag protein n=1 Tax=Lagenidium giganteum TaxID=4803 RepID=A0AAV2ZCH9_9STRA|nr:TPA: hypothetical protein N0F65_003232 [Lagenidium giganteum]
MRGSFNLYRSQLRVFLTTHVVWGHLDGSVVRDPADAALRAQFDARDRDAPLRSVSTSDAERMCELATAREMWENLEQQYTKREFGNYVFALQRLMNSPFEHGQSMEQWLQVRRHMRQQLTNMGYPMTDDQLVDVILTNVAKTHREVVRQFAKTTQMAGAPGRPILSHVMNTLLAETELDEALGEEKPATPVPKEMGVSGRRASPGDRRSASGGSDANNKSLLWKSLKFKTHEENL